MRISKNGSPRFDWWDFMSTAYIDLIYSVTDANNPLILIFAIEERVIHFDNFSQRF